MTSKRSIGLAMEAALAASVVRPVYFLRMDFAGGVKRFHTEIGPKDAAHPIYGSESYTGFGDFGSLNGSIIESVSAAAQPVKFRLTGVKPSFLSDVLTDDYFRREIALMIGVDDEGGELIDDPIIAWEGFMDKVDIALDKNAGEVVLTCDSRAADLEKTSDWRFTHEDLQLEHAGDLGAQYVHKMLDLVLNWGGSNTNYTRSTDTGAPSRGFASPR